MSVVELPNIGLKYGAVVGEGSFAIIRAARKPSGKQVAIKCINKKLSKAKGVSSKDIQREGLLHRHCSPHPNVVKFLDSGADANFYWIAMELSVGGDLFDKIEPDVGVSEDVGHFYFSQLINGVGFLHSKGVAHRDIKPENILLDADGNLKIADFGLASLFRNPKDGSPRMCHTSCGSPPYVAPEVIRDEYLADKADIWSAGVVLFVLFCGITPWQEPLESDPDFSNFVAMKGHVSHTPWNRIPLEALSLLRGMLKLDPGQRYNMEEIRRHPWFVRSNPLISKDGRCRDPIVLATELLGKLRIDLTKTDAAAPDFGTSSQPVHGDIYGATQPEYMMFSQQVTTRFDQPSEEVIFDCIANDPAQLQYLEFAGIPTTMSQRATRFKDLVPLARFTRFYTLYSFEMLVPILGSALSKVKAQYSHLDPMASSHKKIPSMNIQAMDRRRMRLSGRIRLLVVAGSDALEVEFAKTTGDPLEWRHLFKRIVALCPSDMIFIPPRHDM